MKSKTKTRLAVAALLACVSSPALADVAPPPPEPDGAALYTASCAKCHGPDGVGATKIGEKLRGEGKRMPDLVTSKLDKAATRAVIADGTPGTPMKGYAGKLGAAELDALTAFTMKLRR